VDMQVGNRLADHIVDRHERSLSSEGIDQSTGNLLSDRQKWLHQGLRQIQQRVDVLQRGDEDMTLEDRSMIKERDYIVGAKDNRSLNIAAADLAEHVVAHRHETSCNSALRIAEVLGSGSNASSIIISI